MTYLLYETEADLMPQVLTEDQLIQRLFDRTVGPEARLYVPETESFIPALEHILLLARQRGISLDDLPPAPYRGVAPGNGRQTSLGRPDLYSDGRVGPLPYPSANSGTGAPRGTEPTGFGGAFTPPPVSSSLPSSHASRPLPGASPRPSASPTTNGGNPVVVEEGVRKLAAVPIEQFYTNVDTLVEKYSIRYETLLRRHKVALLLIPLAGIGLILLWLVRRDESNLRARLGTLGINKYDWEQMVRSNKSLYRQQRLLRPLSIFMTVVTGVLLFYVVRMPVVWDRLTAMVVNEDDSGGGSGGIRDSGGIRKAPAAPPKRHVDIK